jgi:hypothetical protein
VTKSSYPTSNRYIIAAEQAEDADVRFRKKTMVSMNDAFFDNVSAHEPCYLKCILRRARPDDALVCKRCRQVSFTCTYQLMPHCELFVSPMWEQQVAIASASSPDIPKPEVEPCERCQPPLDPARTSELSVWTSKHRMPSASKLYFSWPQSTTA